MLPCLAVDLISERPELKSTFASNIGSNKSIGAVSPTLGDVSLSGSTQSEATRRSTHPSRSFNLSENLICLPEATLLATKSDLDDVSNHLIGRSVEVLDAFRLGRKPNLPNADGTVTNTHPPTVSFQATSSDTTHISAIPGADSVPPIPVHS